MKNIEIGARLKEERERLGYSQTAFAGLADVTKRSQIGWEKGERYPDALALAHWASHGLDVVYLLQGIRTVPDVPDSLPPDEQLLLDAYRGMKAPDRKALLAEMLTGKKAKPAKEAGVSVKGKNNRVAGRDYNE